MKRSRSHLAVVAAAPKKRTSVVGVVAHPLSPSIAADAVPSDTMAAVLVLRAAWTGVVKDARVPAARRSFVTVAPFPVCLVSQLYVPWWGRISHSHRHVLQFVVVTIAIVGLRVLNRRSTRWLDGS